MSENDALQLIQAKLGEAAEMQLPKRLWYCRPWPEVPEGGFILPVPRLDIILSGRKRVTLAIGGGVTELLLEPGDAYFAPPGTWELHHWDSLSEMLCIVGRREYLRISYYRQNDPIVRPEAIYHHTGRRCSEPVRMLFHLLNRNDQTAAVTGGETATLHLARALTVMARYECRVETLSEESGAARLFEQIGTWLENHFQQPLSREEVAAKFNVSPAYVSRVFRKMTGDGFHDYLTRVRIDFARFLLLESDLPIYRVSEQCGFLNHVHFVRRFREIEGISPGRYRRRNVDSD